MKLWVVGLMLGVVAILIGGGLLVLLAITNDSSVLELEAGDCFAWPIDGGETTIDSIDTLDCDEPHDAEAVLVGNLNPDRDREYPADSDLFAEVDARCLLAAEEIPSEFGLLPIAPNEASWEPLAGRFVCVAIPRGGGTVTGSITPDLAA